MQYRRICRGFCLWTCLIVFPVPGYSAQLSAPECEVAVDINEQPSNHQKFSEGLLWKVEKEGVAPSYVFGTIHVADEAVVTLDDKVVAALTEATTFIMEIVPEPTELRAMARSMYFSDGQRLNEKTSTAFFDETVKLLSAYHLGKDAVSIMKPWAAYLTISYPPEFGQVLDVQLLEKARKNGAVLMGLETLKEQIDIFDKMDVDNQLQLLIDAVCNYELMEADFVRMKQLYLARDLNALYNYSFRYSHENNALYHELIDELLFQRNHKMASRALDILNTGNAFMAIGAMHLPGDEGVLSLLQQNDYKITLVY